MAARVSRLNKEIPMLIAEPPPGITVWSDCSDHTKLSAQILGPDDSPFHDCIFVVSINIPERYPFEPPHVRFIAPTVPYHPNIDNEGVICLDTLKSQPQGSWAPSVNLSSLLLSLRLLLAYPNPEDGLMSNITEEYSKNKSLWYSKAEQAAILSQKKYQQEPSQPTRKYQVSDENYDAKEQSNSNYLSNDVRNADSTSESEEEVDDFEEDSNQNYKRQRIH